MAETSRTSGLIGTLGIKAPVRAATVANIVLSGEQTVDGVALVAEDRVLVKDQATASENGIYYVQAGAWSRAPDFDGALDVVTGTCVNVNAGTVNAVTQWRVTTTGDILPGTTAIAFALSATAFGADIAAITHAATLKRPIAADAFPAWDSVSQTLRQITVESLRERVNIFDYLTEAEWTDVTTRAGLVDVRARIQTRIDALEIAGGGTLYLPPGLYMISSAIVLPSKVFLLGGGSSNTKIKLVNAANTNILWTKDFAALTGTNKWLLSEGVPYGFGFDGITFDGNRANQAVAGGVAIYGKGYTVGFDVKVVEAKGIGFYSECAYKGGQTVEGDMPEGIIGKVQVYKSGLEGFVYRGPHDQPIHDVSVSQAGQDGAYDGVAFEGKINLYNGATYVTGSIHAYACTGRGITLRTHVLANQLTGENCDRDGIVLEAPGETAGMIGGIFATIDLAEAYGNDNNDTGLYWGVRVSGSSNKITCLRVAVSGQQAGGVYNAGNFSLIQGTIIGSNAVSNGIGFRNGGGYCSADIVVQNFNAAGDIGLQTDTAAYCRIAATLFECSTAWKNAGVSSRSTYNIASFSTTGTEFTQAGSFAATDSFDVKLHGATGDLLSRYNGAETAILNGNTALTVTHNGFITPKASDITITLTGDWRNAGVARSWWISAITATQFTITTDVAAPVGGLPFSWELDI